MLFNSLEFVFLFLPFTLAGYYLLIRAGLRDWIFLFLVSASLVFYAVWNPPYVLLLIASMLANYAVGLGLERLRGRGQASLMALGIVLNVAVLFYFKYANFFVDNLNAVSGANYTLERILLPLAISFYTLQQIAFLVDVARGEVRPTGVWRYATFVIFFPQLIAGPIVHYKEMMPQFFGRRLGRFATANLTVGLAIFAIGLFKKTVIADSAAAFATPVYDMAAGGETIGLLAAWRAAICYTIQLYFDFSGYSDMALGLARMFGIKLPPNFHSPLRAASIIEYWRRWHITLQQFIVAYMHQPLVVPLTRFGAERGYGKWQMFALTTAAPTIMLFLVIGFWHGAAWTFVVFGGMHGIYLSVNEFWRTYRRKRRKKNKPGPRDMVFYHLLTLVCVAAANVVFRAEGVDDAIRIWAGMMRFSDLAALPSVLPANAAEALTEPMLFILVAVSLIAFFPNTQQIMGRYHPILGWAKWRAVALPTIAFRWRPSLPWAVITGVVLFLGVAFISRGQTEFIYFNF
ncbi:MBOAT family O-acyltransferase [Meridianimarinicoccus aquatilis]|uniref:Probable alginate O-acetylase AlgI n=1 Tax=Meridianimarinicoccus aquatilis TaxID=2552766 RepID=A0A4R6AVX5_9RHOB|nr:MBOAT family O-acyltransferase [Fluviibacterium aquatile]TDL86406.1 MBOAT family protein [Fluviibacterium aquatile]